MSDKEYIIFCDESDKEGKFYSNFYGGVIVGSSQYERITQQLNAKKRELHFFGEVKWAKVTERYLDKYVALMDCFFEEIKAGNVKVRIMFRQNARKPRGLSSQQIEIQYFLLYYQFIKHAFGLSFIEPSQSGTKLRLYFDVFPDTREKSEQFKGYLLGLQEYIPFRQAGIKLAKEDITEVLSHDHVLLQCLDIVLGSMAFRLNDKHKEKLPGKRRRGKRTVAKEQLYRTILSKICEIKPRFNVGVTTSIGGDLTNSWRLPYLHWAFEPRDGEYHPHLTKSGTKTKNPT